MIHNTKGVPAFLDAWDLTDFVETATKLSQIVVESISLGKSIYNTNIYAVVSDNARAMLKMGRDVNLDNNIWPSTCSSHTANLLAKDVLNQSCMYKVVKVTSCNLHAHL